MIGQRLRLICGKTDTVKKNMLMGCLQTNIQCQFGWDGCLYDCDFKQMLDLKVATKNSRHISQFDEEALNNRKIITGQHCYGCTAGAGSSCGRQVV